MPIFVSTCEFRSDTTYNVQGRTEGGRLEITVRAEFGVYFGALAAFV